MPSPATSSRKSRPCALASAVASLTCCDRSRSGAFASMTMRSVASASAILSAGSSHFFAAQFEFLPELLHQRRCALRVGLLECAPRGDGNNSDHHRDRGDDGGGEDDQDSRAESHGVLGSTQTLSRCQLPQRCGSQFLTREPMPRISGNSQSGITRKSLITVFSI